MNFWNKLCDATLGPCIHERPSKNSVYVTFDDGPDPQTTPQVLEILSKHRAKATFFVIVEKAEQHPEIIHQILSQGHSIGNHSLDHNYAMYFATENSLQKWVERAQSRLTQLLEKEPVGFRSPAGVRTPRLHSVLKAMNIPLIHWNTRFYDSVRPWKAKVARQSAQTLAPGSIVLLHDVQRKENQKRFLRTLDAFLEELSKRGLELEAIHP